MFDFAVDGLVMARISLLAALSVINDSLGMAFSRLATYCGIVDGLVSMFSS